MGKDFFIVVTGSFTGTAIAIGLMLFLSMAAIQDAIDVRIAKIDAAVTSVVEKVETAGTTAIEKLDEIKDTVKDKIKDSKLLEKVLN